MSVHFACIHVVSGSDPQMRTTALGYTQFLSHHSDLWVPCTSRQAQEINNDIFFLKNGKKPLQIYLKPVFYYTEGQCMGGQFGFVHWIGWHIVNDLRRTKNFYILQTATWHKSQMTMQSPLLYLIHYYSGCLLSLWRQDPKLVDSLI